MAAATLVYVSLVGTLATDRAVLLISLVFVLAVGALTLLCRAAALLDDSADRPWRNFVIAWGAFFALTMTGGMLVFRGETRFWIPAAAVTAAPLILGVASQAQSRRRGRPAAS